MPILLNPAEVEITAIRAQGAGGQNVNRVKYNTPHESNPWHGIQLRTFLDARAGKEAQPRAPGSGLRRLLREKQPPIGY